MICGMFEVACIMFAESVAIHLLKSVLICLNLFCECNLVRQDVPLFFFLLSEGTCVT